MEKNKKATDKVKEQPATYETYAALPDDGNRYEVIDGVLELMSPSPTASHQSIASDLCFELKQSCKSDYLIYVAPLDVILSNTNVVQPDAIMIHRSRKHIVTSRGIEGPPDLAVEVLSPSSQKRDRLKKRAVYEKHGVPEYWIIDPEARTLEQFHLDERGKYELTQLYENDEQVVSNRLPCVSFEVSRLFGDVLQ
ncbi:Uma2 family endonuclease [Cohnella sp. LGH]|uniref:Uma2 family endonuclease n=1 Tax=Cohnella sp. LGH TaxID=1619153 RepID=UPI001ADAC99E|nr:Uma2 family endonuclease [Cohnella sp. LGH]QTH41082.1 Uma2 family endonuclease [Cohnella sp. LGH]